MKEKVTQIPSFSSAGDIWHLLPYLLIKPRSLLFGPTEGSTLVELTTEGSAECCTEKWFANFSVLALICLISPNRVKSSPYH